MPKKTKRRKKKKKQPSSKFLIISDILKSENLGLPNVPDISISNTNSNSNTNHLHLVAKNVLAKNSWVMLDPRYPNVKGITPTRINKVLSLFPEDTTPELQAKKKIAKNQTHGNSPLMDSNDKKVAEEIVAQYGFNQDDVENIIDRTLFYDRLEVAKKSKLLFEKLEKSFDTEVEREITFVNRTFNETIKNLTSQQVEGILKEEYFGTIDSHENEDKIYAKKNELLYLLNDNTYPNHTINDATDASPDTVNWFIERMKKSSREFNPEVAKNIILQMKQNQLYAKDIIIQNLANKITFQPQEAAILFQLLQQQCQSRIDKNEIDKFDAEDILLKFIGSEAKLESLLSPSLSRSLDKDILTNLFCEFVQQDEKTANSNFNSNFLNNPSIWKTLEDLKITFPENKALIQMSVDKHIDDYEYGIILQRLLEEWESLQSKKSQNAQSVLYYAKKFMTNLGLKDEEIPFEILDFVENYNQEPISKDQVDNIKTGLRNLQESKIIDLELQGPFDLQNTIFITTPRGGLEFLSIFAYANEIQKENLPGDILDQGEIGIVDYAIQELGINDESNSRFGLNFLGTGTNSPIKRVVLIDDVIGSGQQQAQAYLSLRHRFPNAFLYYATLAGKKPEYRSFDMNNIKRDAKISFKSLYSDRGYSDELYIDETVGFNGYLNDKEGLISVVYPWAAPDGASDKISRLLINSKDEKRRNLAL